MSPAYSGKPWLRCAPAMAAWPCSSVASYRPRRLSRGTAG